MNYMKTIVLAVIAAVEFSAHATLGPLKAVAEVRRDPSRETLVLKQQQPVLCGDGVLLSIYYRVADRNNIYDLRRYTDGRINVEIIKGSLQGVDEYELYERAEMMFKEGTQVMPVRTKSGGVLWIDAQTQN